MELVLSDKEFAGYAEDFVEAAGSWSIGAHADWPEESSEPVLIAQEVENAADKFSKPERISKECAELSSEPADYVSEPLLIDKEVAKSADQLEEPVRTAEDCAEPTRKLAESHENGIIGTHAGFAEESAEPMEALATENGNEDENPSEAHAELHEVEQDAIRVFDAVRLEAASGELGRHTFQLVHQAIASLNQARARAGLPD